MVNRLKDFKIEDRKARPAIAYQVLPMQFGNDEATKRILMHNTIRVILKHKKGIFRCLHHAAFAVSPIIPCRISTTASSSRL